MLWVSLIEICPFWCALDHVKIVLFVAGLLSVKKKSSLRAAVLGNPPAFKNEISLGILINHLRYREIAFYR